MTTPTIQDAIPAFPSVDQVTKVDVKRARIVIKNIVFPRVRANMENFQTDRFRGIWGAAYSDRIISNSKVLLQALEIAKIDLRTIK